MSGKQADDAAKAIVCRAAESRSPMTGRRRRRAAEFAIRSEQFGFPNNGLFAVKKLAVLSDGADAFELSAKRASPDGI